MLGRNDAKFVASLDNRLQSIIMSPSQSSDRACLVAIIRLVGAQDRADKRERMWLHFEKTVGRSIKTEVAMLHATYRAIEHELELNPSPSRARLAEVKAKLATMAKNVDGEPAQQST